MFDHFERATVFCLQPNKLLFVFVFTAHVKVSVHNTASVPMAENRLPLRLLINSQARRPFIESKNLSHCKDDDLMVVYGRCTDRLAAREARALDLEQLPLGFSRLSSSTVESFDRVSQSVSSRVTPDDVNVVA